MSHSLIRSWKLKGRNQTSLQHKWQLDFQLTLDLTEEDSQLSRCTLNRVPHTPSAHEACYPQMVPFMLIHTPHLHWAMSRHNGTNICRQISLLNSSHCADAHHWTCGSMTSWHRYLFIMHSHTDSRTKMFTWLLDQIDFTFYCWYSVK